MGTLQSLFGVPINIWLWFESLYHAILNGEGSETIRFVIITDIQKLMSTIDPNFLKLIRVGKIADRIRAALESEGTPAEKKDLRQCIVTDIFGKQILLRCGINRAQDRMLATLWAFIKALRESDDPVVVADILSVELRQNFERWIREGYAGSYPIFNDDIDIQGFASCGPLYVHLAMQALPMEDPPMFRQKEGVEIDQ